MELRPAFPQTARLRSCGSDAAARCLAGAFTQSGSPQNYWRRSRLNTAQKGARISRSHPQGRILTPKQCGQYQQRIPSTARISQTPQSGTLSRTFLQKWHLYFSDSSHCGDSFDFFITFSENFGKLAKGVRGFGSSPMRRKEIDNTLSATGGLLRRTPERNPSGKTGFKNPYLSFERHTTYPGTLSAGGDSDPSRHLKNTVFFACSLTLPLKSVRSRFEPRPREHYGHPNDRCTRRLSGQVL
jgi:hypothetical protein